MPNQEEGQRFDQIVSNVVADKNIPEESKTSLLSQLSRIGTPLATDPWVYRMVVIFLGLTVLGTVAGGFTLQLKSGAAIPEGLIALGSAAVGALAGLLAPAPTRR